MDYLLKMLDFIILIIMIVIIMVMLFTLAQLAILNLLKQRKVQLQFILSKLHSQMCQEKFIEICQEEMLYKTKMEALLNLQSFNNLAEINKVEHG